MEEACPVRGLRGGGSLSSGVEEACPQGWRKPVLRGGGTVRGLRVEEACPVRGLRVEEACRSLRGGGSLVMLAVSC